MAREMMGEIRWTRAEALARREWARYRHVEIVRRRRRDCGSLPIPRG